MSILKFGWHLNLWICYLKDDYITAMIDFRVIRLLPVDIFCTCLRFKIFWQYQILFTQTRRKTQWNEKRFFKTILKLIFYNKRKFNAQHEVNSLFFHFHVILLKNYNSHCLHVPCTRVHALIHRIYRFCNHPRWHILWNMQLRN